jgi:carbon-monoxide dehydrogenase iron sulfur subunit
VPLIVDSGKCTGCRKCELACSYEKEGVFNPALSRIWVEEVGFPAIPVPLICHQCTNAPCAEVCPVDAITLHGKTGAYLVNVKKCIGCGKCVEACPWGAIALYPESGKAYKCDLCRGKPKCVEACNYGVISLAVERGTPDKRRYEIAEKIVDGWKRAVLQED